jgi:hypothetical protein
MDRSFLSQPEVIAAAKHFVCVRLTTYESKEEGDFLKSFAAGRSGELENTVFTILSHDGKRQLVRASRSARKPFGDSERMADAMSRIAQQYPRGKTVKGQNPELPKVANVRLALNVAACDNQPLVVLFAAEPAARKKLENRVAELAWSEAFSGQFVYVVASKAKELAAVEGLKPAAGVCIIQPDRFGRKGKVLGQAGADATGEELAKVLKAAVALHQRSERTFANHVRQGQKLGVFWETQIPVTDPMELRARERGRQK